MSKALIIGTRQISSVTPKTTSVTIVAALCARRRRHHWRNSSPTRDPACRSISGPTSRTVERASVLNGDDLARD